MMEVPGATPRAAGEIVEFLEDTREGVVVRGVGRRLRHGGLSPCSSSPSACRSWPWLTMSWSKRADVPGVVHPGRRSEPSGLNHDRRGRARVAPSGRTARATARRTRGTRGGSALRSPRGSRDRTRRAPERGAGSGGPEHQALGGATLRPARPPPLATERRAAW